MTILTEKRYFVKTLYIDKFCVIDRATGRVMKTLSDPVAAFEWQDYFNDLDKQDMWEKA